MAYSTVTDLKTIKVTTVLVQLAGPEGATTEPNAAVCAACIAMGDSIIDSKLSPKHSVPFTAPIPAVIKTISMGLGICFLYEHNLISMPADIKKRFDELNKLLDDIAAGTSGLGAAASIGPSIKVALPYSANKFDMNTFETKASGDPDYLEPAEAVNDGA